MDTYVLIFHISNIAIPAGEYFINVSSLLILRDDFSFAPLVLRPWTLVCFSIVMLIGAVTPHQHLKCQQPIRCLRERFN